ncbi:MAG: MerR family transcriptional regulator [Lentihominibacter sp.]
MKIGDFANIFDVSISTIRYYIKNGVLVPSRKESNQFEFSDRDVEEMRIILTLKDLFFSIDEIKHYLKVIRIYNNEDASMAEHLVDILSDKKSCLTNDINARQAAVKTVERRISTLNNMLRGHNFNSSADEESSKGNIGIPVDFLRYLVCPKCGGYFSNELKTVENRIISGHLSCSCGYEAVIEDGIILAPRESEYYTSKDFQVLHYREIPPENADFVFFQYLDELTDEVITLLYQTYQDISQRLKGLYLDSSTRPELIFVPDLASHYLYQNINEPFFNECFKDSLIIVTGFSKENITAIKSHMDAIAPNAKIVYIANTIYELPIRDESIDLWIDATSSYNFAFFHPESLHSQIHRYMKKDSKVVGLTKYYDPCSRSLGRIRNNYSQEMRNHSLLSFFEAKLATDGFNITYEKDIGYTTNPGPYYEYHARGEKHRYLVYSADRL